MTRTNEPETRHAPRETTQGLGGDPLHHEPKPADVGLDPEGRAATGETHHRPSPGQPHAPRFEVDEEEHLRRASDQRSIADLIKELRDEATHLLRQEVNLAKTELNEKASFFGTQAGKIAAGGAVLGVGALLVLSAVACFVAWIFQSQLDFLVTSSLAWGYLIVGAIIAIVGVIMYSSARSKLKREPVAPERTLQSLKDDKQWLTNKTQDVTR